MSAHTKLDMPNTAGQSGDHSCIKTQTGDTFLLKGWQAGKQGRRLVFALNVEGSGRLMMDLSSADALAVAKRILFELHEPYTEPTPGSTDAA